MLGKNQRFQLQRFLLARALAFTLASFGSVCLAGDFGGLDDVTMQVIGLEEIPADVIQNIQLPDFDQAAIKGTIPSTRPLIVPGTMHQDAPLQGAPGNMLLNIEPAPFDPTNPSDLGLAPNDSGVSNNIELPIDTGLPIDPGLQAPPINIVVPTVGIPNDALPPPESNIISPDGSVN